MGIILLVSIFLIWLVDYRESNMNEFERLNFLMDEFKTKENIEAVVKNLPTADLKRFIYILESVGGK
jgi:hypothetical protein